MRLHRAPLSTLTGQLTRQRREGAILLPQPTPVCGKRRAHVLFVGWATLQTLKLEPQVTLT